MSTVSSPPRGAAGVSLAALVQQREALTTRKLEALAAAHTVADQRSAALESQVAQIRDALAQHLMRTEEKEACERARSADAEGAFVQLRRDVEDALAAARHGPLAPSVGSADVLRRIEEQQGALEALRDSAAPALSLAATVSPQTLRQWVREDVAATVRQLQPPPLPADGSGDALRDWVRGAISECLTRAASAEEQAAALLPLHRAAEAQLAAVEHRCADVARRCAEVELRLVSTAAEAHAAAAERSDRIAGDVERRLAAVEVWIRPDSIGRDRSRSPPPPLGRVHPTDLPSGGASEGLERRVAAQEEKMKEQHAIACEHFAARQGAVEALEAQVAAASGTLSHLQIKLTEAERQRQSLREFVERVDVRLSAQEEASAHLRVRVGEGRREGSVSVAQDQLSDMVSDQQRLLQEQRRLERVVAELERDRDARADAAESLESRLVAADTASRRVQTAATAARDELMQAQRQWAAQRDRLEQRVSSLEDRSAGDDVRQVAEEARRARQEQHDRWMVDRRSIDSRIGTLESVQIAGIDRRMETLESRLDRLAQDGKAGDAAVQRALSELREHAAEADSAGNEASAAAASDRTATEQRLAEVAEQAEDSSRRLSAALEELRADLRVEIAEIAEEASAVQKQTSAENAANSDRIEQVQQMVSERCDALSQEAVAQVERQAATCAALEADAATLRHSVAAADRRSETTHEEQERAEALLSEHAAQVRALQEDVADLRGRQDALSAGAGRQQENAAEESSELLRGLTQRVECLATEHRDLAAAVAGEGAEIAGLAARVSSTEETAGAAARTADAATLTAQEAVRSSAEAARLAQEATAAGADAIHDAAGAAERSEVHAAALDQLREVVGSLARAIGEYEEAAADASDPDTAQRASRTLSLAACAAAAEVERQSTSASLAATVTSVARASEQAVTVGWTASGKSFGRELAAEVAAAKEQREALAARVEELSAAAAKAGDTAVVPRVEAVEKRVEQLERDAEVVSRQLDALVDAAAAPHEVAPPTPPVAPARPEAAYIGGAAQQGSAQPSEQPAGRSISPPRPGDPDDWPGADTGRSPDVSDLLRATSSAQSPHLNYAYDSAPRQSGGGDSFASRSRLGSAASGASMSLPPPPPAPPPGWDARSTSGSPCAVGGSPRNYRSADVSPLSAFPGAGSPMVDVGRIRSHTPSPPRRVPAPALVAALRRRAKDTANHRRRTEAELKRVTDQLSFIQLAFHTLQEREGALGIRSTAPAMADMTAMMRRLREDSTPRAELLKKKLAALMDDIRKSKHAVQDREQLLVVEAQRLREAVRGLRRRELHLAAEARAAVPDEADPAADAEGV